MGYSAHAFASYRDALQCLGHRHFELVIVSQANPAPESHRLVEFTVGRERYTPIVVLAPRLDMKPYLEAMQLGVTEYLQKPLTPGDSERVVTTQCQPRQGQITTCAS
jgi:DNA-binding NtrC family response regulator